MAESMGTLARRVAHGTVELDTLYLGRPRWIATALLEGDHGVALVDPGPASALPGLEAALEAAGHRLEDVRVVLLTHIHLDHAGATGLLARRLPDLRVHVHARGARHLIDPARLLASATRLYGADMDRLWGEVAPVPEERVEAVTADGPLRVLGRTIEAAYTPGHAVHHLSYFDPDTGIAYVGDTVGLRLPGPRFVQPVTPPPDIDLEAWATSFQTIRRWQPASLFVTHFGLGEDAAWQLDAHEARLRMLAERVLRSLHDERDDAARAGEFARELTAELRRELPAELADAYEQSDSFEADWHGLARYWRKRIEEPAGDAPPAPAGGSAPD